MSAHHCHAHGCETIVPTRLLMCPRHWRMVPEHLQAEINAEFRPGQCTDKKPSRAWIKAAVAARRYVWFVEQGKFAESERSKEAGR